MAWRRFSSLTRPPCFKELNLTFCLAAALRGPVECWAFWRAAASNAGVSWGDFRKDMVPPMAGCWISDVGAGRRKAGPAWPPRDGGRRPYIATGAFHRSRLPQGGEAVKRQYVHTCSPGLLQLTH